MLKKNQYPDNKPSGAARMLAFLGQEDTFQMSKSHNTY